MNVALLSLLLALFKQQNLRARQRYMMQSVAHLNDARLKDIGLYRVNDTLRPIDDPLALEAELSIKQDAAIKAIIAQRKTITKNKGSTMKGLNTL
jgi:hypothetical protein